MPKLLLVEQDSVLLQQTVECLEQQHLTVETATTSSASQKLLVKSTYEIVILDWYLSNPGGAELCRWYRSRGGKAPLLALTSGDEVEDKLDAFEAGADDCLGKPFAMRELAVRVRALRRRAALTPSRLVQRGPLTIDPQMHTATISGFKLSLTATEFALLEYISRYPNNVLSSTTLLNRVWSDSAGLSPDTVRAYVKRLRQKLEAVGCRDLIENLHGVGYRLNPNAVSSSVVFDASAGIGTQQTAQGATTNFSPF